MRTKLATTALLLALGVGGVALAPAAGAVGTDARHSASQSAALAPAFSAAGSWQLYQSNGFTVTLNVAQDGNGALYGSATDGSSVGTIQAGSVDATSIYFVIGWSNGATGRYTGSLGPDRRLSGTTFDVNHPTSQATWYTNQTF
jgi:hypothetical protein